LNDFYNHGGYPATQAPGSSAAMRAELDAIAAGFDKMPTLPGNAGQFVVVNPSANGLTTSGTNGLSDAVFRLFDDADNTKRAMFQVSGISASTTRVFAFPDANTTLVGTDVAQTLTNKTLTSPTINTPTIVTPTINTGMTVNGTSTFNDPITVTEPNVSSINIRSGAAGSNALMTIGRTGVEGTLGVSGGSNQFVPGDIAGDTVLAASTRTVFGVGGVLQVLLDTSALTAIGSVTARGTISAALGATNTAIGVLGASPALQHVLAGGAADQKVWQEYVLGAQKIYRVLNDAGAAAQNWLEVTRTGATISSVNFANGTVGVGYVAPSYGGGFTTLGVNGTTQPVFDLAVAGVRNATFTANSTTVLLGTTVAKPLHLYANNLPWIQILPTGQVGIGKTPTTALDILGTYALISNGVYSLYWGSGALVGGGGAQGCLRSDSDLLFGIGAAEVARFTSTSFLLSTGTGSFFIGGQRTVAGGSFALAINAAFTSGHGNSRAPDHMKVWLVCVTAEAGYVAGQRVEWIPNRTGFTGGYTAFADATNLSVYTFNATVQLPNASTGVATNITPANWQVRMVGIWQ